ncbi:hypothetical protein J32TS6_29490 [Virgibacillus pantothenticus]|uniref:DUF6366 family protein n=1 Tax=Virgibacillus TaxID=84406 RepID=UPI0009549FEC|nr:MULTISPECIES: DUF6366 family protein [Virgibacillus]MBS7428916.1 hypothetical protein [Virgibacillus sp. 19R1-5]MBU8566668.1 hypothetical protein [Virgibacillus pantothenticus]MBU8600251.1 hypothetical protein [Virgibacillus pantothenticus]MBU8634824.1 hypothetical protein [Virgibacillus pantothenticus]MBU8642388.1 hypothetical protein [Virgibacillus pantothenticus]
MNENKETPERKRKRLRQEEGKSNPGGNLKDTINRDSNGSMIDLVEGIGPTSRRQIRF